MKKLLSFLLALMLLVTSLPVSTSAAEVITDPKIIADLTSEHEHIEECAEDCEEEAIYDFSSNLNNEIISPGTSAIISDDDTTNGPLSPNGMAEEVVLEATITEVEALSVAEGDYFTTVEDAAAYLRKCMVNRENTITVNYKYEYPTLDETGGVVNDLLNDIYNKAMEHTGVANEGDYLRWNIHAANHNGSFTFENGVYMISAVINVTYLTTKEQEDEIDVKINELVTELILNSSASDYKKVKNIYNWICTNVSYDYTNLENTEYLLKFSTYAALINHSAVCQGYATLFYRLALEAGIDSRVITGISENFDGEAENHAWNIVKLDELYYNLDSTWDAQNKMYGLEYEYFLRGSNEFYNHIIDDEYENDVFTDAYSTSKSDYIYTGDETYTYGDYTYEIIDNYAVIVKYGGNSADVQIPEYLGGLPVKVIAADSFAHNDNIVSIVIPNTIERIEDGWCNRVEGTVMYYGAFSCCENLEKVILDKNSALQYMGKMTFAGCTKLNKIVLPDSLRSIELEAFSGCESLEELILPDGLIYIGQHAIMGTSIKKLHIPNNTFIALFFSQNLEEFSVNDDHPIYKVHDGVLYSNFAPIGTYEGWTLMHYPGNKAGSEYRVADFCTHIWGDVFIFTNQPKYLEKLYIGNANAAINIIHGTDVSDNSLARIRFEIIPDYNNPYFTSYNKMLFSKDMKELIQVPSNITGTVIIPEGVEYIHPYAMEVGSYTSVILPESLKSMGGAIFWQTPSLETIYIPKSLESITGSSIFQECDKLNSVYYGGTREQWEELFNPDNVVFPPSYLSPKFKLYDGTYAEVSLPTCGGVGQVKLVNSNYGINTTIRISALKHDYSNYVFNASERTHSKKCFNCGAVVKDICMPDAGIVIKEATENTSGIREHMCEICNGVYQMSFTYNSVPMYRMYNPNSGEHFYTGSTEERNILVNAGWHYEGVAFNFPVVGKPVYRLYEPKTGEHLYTMDEAEKAKLLSEGWNYEGVAFNSAGEDEVAQYRLHNPNATCGAYHFTGSKEERDILIAAGWEYQGIGWYSCLR